MMLTIRKIASMKPGPKARKYPDGHVTGLYFALQPTGKASWYVRYRVAGRSCKLVLGPYPSSGLPPPAAIDDQSRDVSFAAFCWRDPRASRLRRAALPTDGGVPHRDLKSRQHIRRARPRSQILGGWCLGPRRTCATGKRERRGSPACRDCGQLGRRTSTRPEQSSRKPGNSRASWSKRRLASAPKPSVVRKRPLTVESGRKRRSCVIRAPCC